MEEGRSEQRILPQQRPLGASGGQGHGALLAPVICNVPPAVYNRSLKILSLWDGGSRLLPAPSPPPPTASGKEGPGLRPQG